MAELKEVIAYENGYKKRDAEIVRCKDCKWYEPKWGCSLLDLLKTDMDKWFCADGERKETHEKVD